MGARGEAPNLNPTTTAHQIRIFNEIQEAPLTGYSAASADINVSTSNNRPQQQQQQQYTKVKYYYKVKLLESLLGRRGEGFKIKLDRLSVASLFDRNNHLSSSALDVVLGGMVVSLLAASLICKGLYTDLSLVIFSFVVAGAQFSLLKSAQPDAASPIHGFNSLAAYSRPIYFSLLAFMIVLIDVIADYSGSGGDGDGGGTSSNNVTVGLVKVMLPSTTNPKLWYEWQWAPPWIDLYNQEAGFIFSARDFLSNAILLLPLLSAMGLLPQVNTLFHHLVEQIDMHLFGATASFNLTSAVLSLGRSVLAVVVLALVGHFSHSLTHSSATMQGIAFSAFISLTLSTAFVMSRWSSNPLFVRILWGSLFPNSYSLESTTTALSSARTSASATNPFKCCTANLSEKGAGVGVDEEEKEGHVQEEHAQEESTPNEVDPLADPLPEILHSTIIKRAQHDLFYSLLNGMLVFGIHSTSLFQYGQPHLQVGGWAIIIPISTHFRQSSSPCVLLSACAITTFTSTFERKPPGSSSPGPSSSPTPSTNSRQLWRRSSPYSSGSTCGCCK